MPRRAAMPRRWTSSPPAGAARQAAGHGRVGSSDFYSFDENL